MLWLPLVKGTTNSDERKNGGEKNSVFPTENKTVAKTMETFTGNDPM